MALAGWLRQRGLWGGVVGVDWAARNLTAARQNLAQTPDVSLLQADALRLPLADNSVDYVISSMFLHHFTREQAVDVLRSAFRCARRAIIMSDLVRGRIPLLAFLVGARFIASNPISLADGPLSIRRSFTPPELRDLAAEADLTNAHVHTYRPFRMTLVAHKVAHK